MSSKFVKFYYLGILLICALLSARSLIIIGDNYINPLYWDQWDSIISIMGHPNDVISIKYIFLPHTNHVIATTKLLIFLDFFIFNFANGPMVGAVVACAIIMSILIALLFFDKQKKGLLFFVVLSTLVASSLSMVQWQNLLWGFQQPFYLVTIGAVLSIICALRISETTDMPRYLCWSLALFASIAFCVFSLGNGIVIPVSILVFFVLIRYRLLASLIFFAIGLILASITIFLIKDSPTPGDMSFRTPLHLITFFFMMVGSPITGNHNDALIIGITAVVLNAFVVVLSVLVPWLQGKQVDRIMAALLALCIFLMGSAAAAAYGRVSLGLAGAFASRYTTPMLLFFTVTMLMYVRYLTISGTGSKRNTTITTVLLTLTVLIIGFTSLRRDNALAYDALSRAVTSAAYFVASGVNDEVQLKELYPRVEAIVPFFEAMRAKKINIFAEHGGLPMPTASDILQAATLSADRVCARSAIASVSPLPAQQWKVSGWATDDKGLTPTWIFAFDHNKRLLGFTKPLEAGPDGINDVRTHSPLKGFLLPVGTTDPSEKRISLSVTYGGAEQPCLIPMRDLPGAMQ